MNILGRSKQREFVHNNLRGLGGCATHTHRAKHLPLAIESSSVVVVCVSSATFGRLVIIHLVSLLAHNFLTTLTTFAVAVAVAIAIVVVVLSGSKRFALSRE